MGSTSHNGAAFCALAHNRVIAAACEREREKESENKREEEREVEEKQAPAKAPQKGKLVAKKGGGKRRPRRADESRNMAIVCFCCFQIF